MNTNVIGRQPVVLVPASLSNDYRTRVEVVRSGPAVYLASLNQDGDSHDTHMTPHEARQLAQALLEAADQVGVLRLVS